MQNATVERLSKIIAEPKQGEEPGRNRRTPQVGNLLSHLKLAEGWFSFFLLALVVYSTIWCVQAVNWVNHLGLLTPITALGLLFGIIAAKQQRVPRVVIHLLAFILGLLLAFWQTSSVDYAGSASAFMNNIRAWIQLAIGGGTSTDDSIFLFFILALGFLLAYTSTWLVYRTRSPWLMLLANAIVLLINLSNIDAGYVIFLVIFLVAALLLLLRFNLYESSSRWKRQGLRCSDDLNWEFMQAGALISLGILVFSWLLPWGYVNQPAAQIWSADGNPWVNAQNLWNRLLSVSGGSTPQNHGTFANTLTLGGNPNLANTPVFQVKTSDGNQYLISVTYDRYDGVKNWSNGSQGQIANKANTIISDGSASLRLVSQTIKVINPPGVQYPYLFGASQIASTDQSTHLSVNRTDGEVIAWLRDNGRLAAGDVYTVVSYVSSADLKSLRTVPMPVDSPKLPPNYDGEVPLNYYDPNILSLYTRLPAGLSQQIKDLAVNATSGAANMYDKVVALESYLRSHYTYDTAITAPPAGTEATQWFLFQSKRGYCNYFASAMALMARELGIPARVAAGYTYGKFNPATESWDINGTDAHAWTQVYFAGYGWVNFEPSQTFSTFSRPLLPPNPTAVGTQDPSQVTAAGTRRVNNPRPEEDSGGFGPSSNDSFDLAGQLRMDVGIVLLALVAFILGGLIYFGFWWRRLFQGVSLPGQIYGRVRTLAGWAGVSTHPSQTPHESMHALSTIAPDEGAKFERLGDIYTRERWADPQSSDHPGRSGEVGEIPGLWKTLQPRLVVYVLRHPHFLRSWPSRIRDFTRRLLSRRSATRKNAPVVVEEELK